MTREEAIKRFETLLLHVDTDCVMGMKTTEAIKMAIKALKQPEPCEDAVSRKAAIDGLNDAVHEHNITDFDAVATILALPPVTPKQRTGKWILDRSGAYCCSECMEPCAGYVMMKPRDKFCKMCGAKMEV